MDKLVLGKVEESSGGQVIEFLDPLDPTESRGHLFTKDEQRLSVYARVRWLTLDREQTQALVGHLQTWLDTGSFEEPANA